MSASSAHFSSGFTFAYSTGRKDIHMPDVCLNLLTEASSSAARDREEMLMCQWRGFRALIRALEGLSLKGLGA